MTGYEYEKKCAKLLEAKGFTNVRVTPGSGDQGIDVLAYRGEKKYGVQCKYYEGTVGNKAVQEAFTGASFYDCAVAMVVTNSKLTGPAKTLAKKLGVEVWEGIDAIYLKNHDAEYIKREEEKEKAREEKEKAEVQATIQRECMEFRQWQAAYKAISPKRKEAFRKEMEPLEQNYAKRTEELGRRYGELSAQLSALESESEMAAATLAGASWYQFRVKKQAQEQMNANKIKMEQLSLDIETEKERHEEQRNALAQEHKEQLKQIREKVDEQTPIPPYPEALAWIKPDSWYDAHIWLELCSYGEKIKYYEVERLLGFGSNAALDRLSSQGAVTLVKEDSLYCYYSVNVETFIEAFFKMEEAYDRLAKYTKAEIERKITNRNMRAYNRRVSKLKQERAAEKALEKYKEKIACIETSILGYLRKMGSGGATKEDIVRVVKKECKDQLGEKCDDATISYELQYLSQCRNIYMRSRKPEEYCLSSYR